MVKATDAVFWLRLAERAAARSVEIAMAMVEVVPIFRPERLTDCLSLMCLHSRKGLVAELAAMMAQDPFEGKVTSWAARSKGWDA